MSLSDTTPFGPFEWMLASRYLRPRRKEGLISIIAIISFIGIMLGVMTLIVVMAVFNGFRQELFHKLLGLNGHVVVNKVGDTFSDFDDVRMKINEIAGVVRTMPVLEGQALFSNADNPSESAAVFVRGMRADDISSLNLVQGGLKAGSVANFDGSESIALGKRLAQSLGVTIGDRVKLTTNRGKTTVFGIKPNSKIYPVSAIFEIGMAEYDKTIAFLPFTEAQAFFNYPNQAHVLEVMVQDPHTVGAMTKSIETKIGPVYGISDWRQRNATIFSVIDVERNMMFLIISLITLVALLNVISGLTMLVKDKTRDIAILRTMGASPGNILRVFLMTGAAIGITGTIAGFILGTLICRNIDAIQTFIKWTTGQEYDGGVYLITKLPAIMDPWITSTIVFGSIAMALLATIVPSWRASRIDPVEALRYA